MTYAEMMAGLIMLRGSRRDAALREAQDEAERRHVETAFWASECRRYRRALDRIAECEGWYTIEHLRAIARAALEETA